jgi:hypothetical protein
MVSGSENEKVRWSSKTLPPIKPCGPWVVLDDNEKFLEAKTVKNISVLHPLASYTFRCDQQT